MVSLVVKAKNGKTSKSLKILWKLLGVRFHTSNYELESLLPRGKIEKKWINERRIRQKSDRTS